MGVSVCVKLLDLNFNSRMNTFSDRLVTIRKKHSQTKLAEWLGVSVRSLLHYEKGERFPNAERLELLCRSASISPTWLILGEGPMLLTEDDTGQPKELIEQLQLERELTRELALENRELRIELDKARAAPTDKDHKDRLRHSA